MKKATPLGSPLLPAVWAMGPDVRWGSHSLPSACPGSEPPAAAASPSPKGHPSSRKLIASAKVRWECAEHGEPAEDEKAKKSEEAQQEKHSMQRRLLLPLTSLFALHRAGEVWAVHLRKWLLAEWNKREHKMFCVQYQK